MQNARLNESQSGIKMAGRNINNLRYAHTTLIAEREERKSLLMKVKEENEKAGLKLKIQKTKIVASNSITSWQIDGDKVESVTDFIFLGFKITVNGDCSHEIKTLLLLLLLLLLSRFSRVRLCATPKTAAHQAPPPLGFSRQEHWSGLPFPSPMHESESESEVAQSCLTRSDPMDCNLPGSSVHGIFQARVLEWVAIAFSEDTCYLGEKL